MTVGNPRPNRPVSRGLPRQLYAIIVALAVWLIFSVWGFFGSGYTPLALAVVSLFIVIAVGLPLLLGLIARRHRADNANPTESDSLSEWLDRDFEAHTGRMRGAVAAAQILLPIAAVAFGMTIFALVRHFDGVV
jgi:hypothetical protein